jgi:uncharacterized repeat protein (TIGR01451 family)
MRKIGAFVSSLFVTAVAGAAALPMYPVISTAATTTETAVVAGPMLEITKNCPRLRYIGRDATFEINVTNKGTGAASNVMVTDTIGAGVDFVSADNNGQRSGNNVVWSLGTLDAGKSVTLKIMLRCNTIAKVTNTAKVTYCSEAVASCEMEVKGIPAILLECVDDPDPIEVGRDTTYTIMVTNQGSATDSNIVVECTLAPEQDFVKAGGATEGKADGKIVKFAPLGSLAPKARATWTLTVKGTKSADVRFKVQMKSDQTETPVMETESTHIYE